MFYFFRRKKEFNKFFVCFDVNRILIVITSAILIGKGCFISFDAKRNLIDVLFLFTQKGI